MTGVELWVVDLTASPTPVLLSAEEQARADRFLHDDDRRRYLHAHYALHTVLARHTNDLRFLTGEHGKPALANECVHFNLSHSGELALIAVASFPVGVDIEQIRDNFDHTSIAPDIPTRELFYRHWTRHEAHLKAHGLPLGTPLPDDHCTLHDLEVHPGYAAALATPHPLPTLPPLQWL